MAEFDNPFPDPFADPVVQQASVSRPTTRPIDDFNPFAAMPISTAPPIQTGGGVSSSAATLPLSTTTVPPPQPAVQMPSSSPPPSYMTDDLRQRQEELERKAADLQRREEELSRNTYVQARINNFPPLPNWCPVKPCFYQDISVDIPVEFQSIVRVLFYLWIAYAALLLLNVLGSLAYLITSSQVDSGNNSGTTFGLSLLFLVLFVPCSFVCWFRPAYNAFRSDSSFNFFVFFFVFFMQACACIIQCLGIKGSGTVGILSSLDMFTANSLGAKAVGGAMIIIGALFGLLAAIDFIMLIRVHRIYRSTGASFQKAQAEFAHGVMSNRTVQQTAGNVAAEAAKSSFNSR